MAPKRSIIQISKTELFTVYIPVIQKRMTRGKGFSWEFLKCWQREGLRKVEDEKHKITYIHAGDNSPKESCMLTDH